MAACVWGFMGDALCSRVCGAVGCSVACVWAAMRRLHSYHVGAKISFATCRKYTSAKRFSVSQEAVAFLLPGSVEVRGCVFTISNTTEGACCCCGGGGKEGGASSSDQQ